MLKVSVISPEAVLFEGETDSVVAPAYDGEIGILTGHAPLMALLGDGELRLGTGSGRRFNVSGGFGKGERGVASMVGLRPKWCCWQTQHPMYIF